MRFMNLRYERVEGEGLDLCLGLASSEFAGLIGSEMEERAGVVCGELSEHLLDEGDGAVLAGSEDRAVGSLG